MIWWQYLLLVNIYLLLFYGFYFLFLSRETFFQLNRIYLVAASVMSFFIPLIQSEWVKNLFITQRVKYTIYTSPVMLYQVKATEATYVTIGQILVVVYLIGILLLAARLVIQLVILNKIIDKPDASAAYSFFKKIRLGEGLEHNEVIAAHENAHARQWHSVDIMMTEAVMIINWFNPVVYFYRNALKHIHEFIADRQALKSGMSKADYALLLLSQTFDAPVHELVNPFFNRTLLRRRVAMLQKNKSRRLSLVKYGLSVPLFILMLILSAATVNNSNTFRSFNKKVEQVFLTPATPNTSIEVKTGDTTENESSSAVSDTSHKSDGPIFTTVEKVPEFPGGLNAFGKFLAQNIKYPADSRTKGVQGRVELSFIVEQDGSLSAIKVVHGLAADIDRESLRVLSLSPKWTPGMQNGHIVRVTYTIPIAFTLSDLPNPVKHAENKIGMAEDDKKYLIQQSEQLSYAAAKPDTGKKFTVDLLHSKGTPLYLLDGKEIASLNNINPNNIQSIQVLKEENATSVYGVRGAFGVILITSKNKIQSVLAPARQ